MYDMYAPPVFPGGTGGSSPLKEHPGGTGGSSPLKEQVSQADTTVRSGESDSEFTVALQLALDRRDNGGAWIQ